MKIAGCPVLALRAGFSKPLRIRVDRYTGAWGSRSSALRRRSRRNTFRHRRNISSRSPAWCWRYRCGRDQTPAWCARPRRRSRLHAAGSWGRARGRGRWPRRRMRQADLRRSGPSGLLRQSPPEPWPGMSTLPAFSYLLLTELARLKTPARRRVHAPHSAVRIADSSHCKAASPLASDRMGREEKGGERHDTR